ncbi:hypothetical protein ACFQ1S_18370, partial [Kibdelosporangium lantanae]
VATVGWTPAGKRVVKSASGKTKTEAKNKLKEILRDYDDGLDSAQPPTRGVRKSSGGQPC